MRQHRYRGIIRGLVVIGLFTGVVILTDQAQAASGNGPYYAEPSWSQKLPAATRFVVLTDWNSEAVLDRNTGLVWEKSPDTAFRRWSDAGRVCINKNVGGQKGWRLPAIAELASLIDPATAPPGPTLPPGHPFTNVQNLIYWSASTLADSPENAWIVVFASGDVAPCNKLDPFNSWCVRGGMNADVY